MNAQPKRVRRRDPELALQAALNDAEELGRVTPTPENIEQMRLLKVRLSVLKSQVAQKLKKEIAELTRRVEDLEAENARLRHNSRPIRDPEISEAIERYERSKHAQTDNAV